MATAQSEQKRLLKELWATLFDVFDSKLDQFTLLPLSTGKTSGIETDNTTSSSARNASRDSSQGSFTSDESPPTPDALLEHLFRFSQMDNPDSLLLRFMRARKWDVKKAAMMVLNTIRWRIEFGTDDIIAKGEQSLVRSMFETGKSYVRGVDVAGRPIFIINVAKHVKDEQPLEELQKFTIFSMETGRLLMTEPGETACVIFNLTDFTMASMDLPYIKFLIQCFEAYYPESLGVLLILNAPWIFSGVWRLISPLLDPVVAAKIQFVPKFDGLSKFIPKENIIPAFWTSKSSAGNTIGATDNGNNEINANINMNAHPQDTYEYHYVPPVDGENPDMKTCAKEKEAALEERKNCERKFEILCRKWCGRDSRPCIIGRKEVPNSQEIEVPSSNDIDGQREKCIEELRNSWWQLDKFVRSRTMYHRIGVLRDGGRRNVWY